MHLKRNIATCAGFLLVLMLGVVMVCGGCKAESPEWNYTGTFGRGNETTEPTETTDTAGPIGTQGTTGATEDTTASTDATTLPTTGGENVPAPPVSGGTTGSTVTNPDPTTNPTEATDPTETTGTTEPTTGPADSTDPTDSTESTTGTTESTDPTESTDSTDPTESTDSTESTEPAEPVYVTYEQYIAMSSAEQRAYMNTFPSITAFNNWLEAARAAYEAANPKETIGPDGNIDLN